MKSPRGKHRTLPPATPRTFAWGVVSTEIPLLRAGMARAALDGCSCGGDCGAIRPSDKPRKKRAAGSAR